MVNNINNKAYTAQQFALTSWRHVDLAPTDMADQSMGGLNTILIYSQDGNWKMFISAALIGEEDWGIISYFQIITLIHSITKLICKIKRLTVADTRILVKAQNTWILTYIILLGLLRSTDKSVDLSVFVKFFIFIIFFLSFSLAFSFNISIVSDPISLKLGWCIATR